MIKIKVKKSLVLLFLLIILFSCKSTYTKIGDKDANYIPYYLKVYEADSLFLVENYQESYKILDSVFKRYEPISLEGYVSEYGDYLASAVMTGNTKNFRKKVIYGFENFGSIDNSKIDTYRYTDTIIKIAKITSEEIDSLVQKYNSKLNLSLRNELLQMIKEDQFIRKNGVENEIVEIEKMKIAHRKKMDAIFSTYGYPSYGLLGINKGYEFEDVVVFHILLLHQDNNYLEKIMPFLLESVKQGKMFPEDYAIVYDRYTLNKVTNSGNYQFYTLRK
ncbi:hypothetical protein LXD69_02065 [Flavobacterium sediminilitoris]|uniref:Lipoprotein n=1 Tax=Flavobacterium sediminilitoris TaxID=2024526 RepID=A0ABY4HP12_9FLAO|nr:MULTISPECIES: hypothetical protein [Flavobacterium]UOX34313.1 hypothetical protein LXD69_02065 [Flavobacterium sediminilitoris]